jgi:site-specific DNA-methyltransferase (adenine-specific)
VAITEASKGTAQRQDWATPWPLFRLINAEFNFTLDAAASSENAKCERYLTELEDGLAQSWAGERVFINPPYGKAAPEWVKKAYWETASGCELVVCLVVPRTDTEWWHRYTQHANEVRFLKGRVAFEDPTSGQRSSPQDPSCLLVFRRGGLGPPRMTFWDWKADLQRAG